MALVRATSGWQVLDADSTLPSPTPLREYLEESFRPLPESLAHFRPRFRVVEAVAYRQSLCTDRRHMRGRDGGWLKPPPPWPPIGEGSNLMRFVDTSDADFAGEVLDLRGLLDWADQHA